MIEIDEKNIIRPAVSKKDKTIVFRTLSEAEYKELQLDVENMYALTKARAIESVIVEAEAKFKKKYKFKITEMIAFGNTSEVSAQKLRKIIPSSFIAVPDAYGGGTQASFKCYCLNHYDYKNPFATKDEDGNPKVPNHDIQHHDGTSAWECFMSRHEKVKFGIIHEIKI